MAVITSLRVAPEHLGPLPAEPGPSGHVFLCSQRTGFLGSGGPRPFHQSCLLLPIISGVTHEISFTQRIPLLSKMFAETT